MGDKRKESQESPTVGPIWLLNYTQMYVAQLNWADLRNDKMTNPAPGLWPILVLGPTAGQPRIDKQCRLHQKSAPEANSKPRSWMLVVFGAGRKKTKL